MKKHLRLLPLLCLLTLPLALSACDLHPVYGTSTSDDGTPVVEEMNAVAIDSIPDRTGQEMRNDLIDRMYGKGRPDQPRYRLTIALRTNEEDIGLLSNATSTLAKIDAYADYQLFDLKGKRLLYGTAHSSSSYDRLNNQYATLASNRSALDRTVHELSEQVTNRLSLYFAERPSYDLATINQNTDLKVELDKKSDEQLAEQRKADDKALARKAAREKAAADHAAGLDSNDWLSGF